MKVLGILLIVVGVVLGIYVGGWLCFIGGIIQVIEQLKADTIVPITFALGLAKVFGCGLAFCISAMLLIGPGLACLKR